MPDFQIARRGPGDVRLIYKKQTMTYKRNIKLDALDIQRPTVPHSGSATGILVTWTFDPSFTPFLRKFLPNEGETH